jgi:hypothetical protein
MRLMLLLLICHFALAIELPVAPDGFTWQEVPEIKAAFLKPTGWYFKREKDKGTLAYFITKEEIRNGGEFQTGLTVNVFHPKNPAVEHAESFIDERVASTHGKKWTRDYGPFREFGCLCKVVDAGGSTMTNTLMVANPKTNTLYLLTFESPDAEWDTAWKTGTKIMDTLAIDDEI